MFAPKFITRILPGLALACLALAACSENPVAPLAEWEATPSSFVGTVGAQDAADKPEVERMPRVRVNRGEHAGPTAEVQDAADDLEIRPMPRVRI